MANCLIKRYDPEVTEPPFEFLDLGEFDCVKPEVDPGGEKFYEMLHDKCNERGFRFRFYSMSEHPDYEFEVTVW